MLSGVSPVAEKSDKISKKGSVNVDKETKRDDRMGGAYHRYEEDKDYIDFNTRLAARLRAARIGAGITQDELSRKTGISKSVLSKSENSNDPQKTPAYIVKRYAEISGRDITDFFEDTPHKSKTTAKSEKVESVRKQLTWLSEEELDIVSGLISSYIRIRKNH